MDMYILDAQAVFETGVSYLGDEYSYFSVTGEKKALNNLNAWLKPDLFTRFTGDELCVYGNSDNYSSLFQKSASDEEQHSFLNKLKLLLEISTDSIILPHSGKLFFYKPLIMGVINANEDSFFSKSRVIDDRNFLSRVSEMVSAGADIIDIGGESSRPGALPITPEEEQNRIIPLIRKLRESFDIPVSVDTYRKSTAEMAFNVGADIINDISGLQFDDSMAEFAAESNMPVVIMHIKGMPETMQNKPFYSDVIAEILGYFSERINYALSMGIKRENLILDPGIGFGKRLTDNLEILRRLKEFKKFKLPLLLGTSRKSFIGEVLNQKNPDDRLSGTLGTTALGMQKGVKIFRVHDVKQNREIADLVFNIIK
jgi:dihydropteroate synthase